MLSNVTTIGTPLQTVSLPKAPRNASPVPWLTSIHSTPGRGHYGDARYPGNCGGHLIRDLLLYFRPQRVLDPMTGSGTCRDVCRELGIECYSGDIKRGFDCCSSQSFEGIGRFDFVWVHPPYWRQKVYSDNPLDLSTTKTLQDFLTGLWCVVCNCRDSLVPGGKMAVLMGDYSDREAGFVPLCHYTKRLCFDAGLVQKNTDIIRFQHNNSSSHKTYRSSFIPGLHDVCLVVEKPF